VVAAGSATSHHGIRGLDTGNGYGSGHRVQKVAAFHGDHLTLRWYWSALSAHVQFMLEESGGLHEI
jgi:hypothetical protein